MLPHHGGTHTAPTWVRSGASKLQETPAGGDAHETDDRSRAATKQEHTQHKQASRLPIVFKIRKNNEEVDIPCIHTDDHQDFGAGLPVGISRVNAFFLGCFLMTKKVPATVAAPTHPKTIPFHKFAYNPTPNSDN